MAKSRPVRKAGDFLVRLDGEYFFSRFAADGRAMGVRIPSASMHFATYVESDDVAQTCRAQGFNQCAVTDRFGNVYDVVALKEEADRQKAKYDAFWK
jgi:hypothetical protein